MNTGGKVNFTRVSTAELQMHVREAAARVILGNGVEALAIAAVRGAAGVTESGMRRAYTDRSQLMTAVYAHARARVTDLCSRQPLRGRSGVGALVALTYDMVEHASADPLVRAVHALEVAGYAAETGLGSVYHLWGDEFTAILVGGGDRGRDPLVAAADDRQIVEVVGVLVAAIAGFCDPRRSSMTTTQQRLDRLHIVLYAVLPTLCTNSSDADSVRLYLTRVHERTVDHDAVVHTRTRN